MFIINYHEPFWFPLFLTEKFRINCSIAQSLRQKRPPDLWSAILFCCFRYGAFSAPQKPKLSERSRQDSSEWFFVQVLLFAETPDIIFDFC
jgi:hypothetical protein